MKILHIIFCVALIAILIWLNATYRTAEATAIGGLSWLGWVCIFLAVLVIGFVVFVGDTARAFGFFRLSNNKEKSTHQVRTLSQTELTELGIDKYRGPIYPHPVIFPERCIGCQACVDACPHDVLAIVDGTASAVAPDLCMEDTACQAECPVNPKACIVINTAKDVRSLPTPTRDGASFETNVPGCFIIGDVSGVPLIKNAVKEGSDVIAHIVRELASSPAESKADIDVAIIGIGPGGASAAVTARDAGLRFVGIEQDKVLSTIELYPKGKYIFFKPDTKDWSGGIPVAGLGLTKPKYGAQNDSADDALLTSLETELDAIVNIAAPRIVDRILATMPQQLKVSRTEMLGAKIDLELRKRVIASVKEKGHGDWQQVFKTHFLPARDDLISRFSDEIVDQLQTKIPGDQRENILEVWHSTLSEKGIKINDYESCRSVKPADDGDYFIIETELGTEKLEQVYKARRVVIAIGLRGAPNKLRLPNEDIKAVIDGKEVQKVLYALSNPMDFKGKNVIVVGGGNVAVEAAVDLVAVRDGTAISPRLPDEMNRVTVLVRDNLAPTVKFGNKFQLYRCADEGIIDLQFGVGIKEMKEHEVVLEDVVTKQELGTIPNDHVFALIGGERPNRFLESIGITIK